MKGKLFVVGTPIGNLGDMSPRAVETLSNVDFIAAEDTRVTLKLLNHFGIKKETVSYFEHNKRERGEVITARILEGESCALCTDAGMPAISDPGEDLVRLCRELDIPVETVPGPTAFATALAVSGMSTGRFTFEGFLSVSKKSRREHLEELTNERRTMVFYEAPHKLAATLRDMYPYFGDRKIALVRELTKIHEETVITTIGKAMEKYSYEKPRGEFVLIIEGKKDSPESLTFEDAVGAAKQMVAAGESINNAAKKAALGTPYKKSDIYRALL